MNRETPLRPDDVVERAVDVLSSEDLYYGHPDGPVVWRPERFDKNLPFYPVYCWNGLVSVVPLYLILRKGSFRPNSRAARAASHPDFRYNPYVVDAEIDRIPDRTDYSPEITAERELVERVSRAMVRDIEEIGRRVGHDVNLVLCGGKDSLNMLLLPWRRPVRILSARPNLPLVRAFVERNDLGLEVKELKDGVDVCIGEEVLLNACANNLEHCRWTGHLKEIVNSTEGRCVLWAGQLGDQLLTTNWRTYRADRLVHYGGSRVLNTLRSMGARLRRKLRRFRQAMDPQGFYFDQLWKKGAHWQGANMPLTREATGAPLLSGYHGRHVTAVIRRTDFPSAVTRDLRPDIGRELFGGNVRYPEENPGPEPSRFRAGASTMERFRTELEAATDGVDILPGHRG